MDILCKVSLGELVDKLSILMIKEVNISDEEKVNHVRHEKALLQKTLNDLNLDGIDLFLSEIKAVNEQLWKIEDDIREKERQKEFDEEFIELARAVYVTNDQRFDVKNRINEKYQSGVVEVKSYEKY